MRRLILVGWLALGLTACASQSGSPAAPTPTMTSAQIQQKINTDLAK